MKSYWGYTRVSVLGDRGGESFISPAEQERKIRAWAEMKGVEVAGIEPDINVSGGKTNRPGLDRILERLENREADGIVVSNLDRLSRLGVTDALELIARIKDYGADIAIIEPSIDTTDPVTGEFVLTLFLALNRMERQRAKVRWAEAGENAIKRKIHTAQSPFGYMRSNEYDKNGNWIRTRDDRDGQKDTEPRLLVPHPTEAPIVKEMFRARAAGESWGSLNRRLNEMGSTSRLGHAWTTSRVKQIIARRTYLGIAHYGDFEQKDAHEPLVDPVTWEAAQARRGVRNSDAGGLLRGVLRCANCRYTMRYDNHIGPSAKEQGRNPRYLCVRGRSDHGSVCSAPGTVVAVDSASGIHGTPIPGIEPAVVDAVLTELEKREQVVFHAVGDTQVLEELDAEIARLEHDLSAYLSDSQLRDVLSRENYLAGAKEKQQALDEVKSHRQEALKNAYEPLNGKSVAKLREEWDEMDVAAQRDVIASVVQAVFVRKRENGDAWWGSTGRFHIVWRDDPEIDVPRQGRRGWVTKPFVFPDADPVDVGVAELQPA